MTAREQVIRWEAPPPTTRRTVGRPRSERWDDVAAALRANPGAWAVVHQGEQRGKTEIATRIRYGHMDCFTPAGDYDATARIDDGTVTIYARYLGETETEASLEQAPE